MKNPRNHGRKCILHIYKHLRVGIEPTTCIPADVVNISPPCDARGSHLSLALPLGMCAGVSTFIAFLLKWVSFHLVVLLSHPSCLSSCLTEMENHSCLLPRTLISDPIPSCDHRLHLVVIICHLKRAYRSMASKVASFIHTHSVLCDAACDLTINFGLCLNGIGGTGGSVFVMFE